MHTVGTGDLRRKVSHLGKHIEQDTFIMTNELCFPSLDIQT